MCVNLLVVALHSLNRDGQLSTTATDIHRIVFSYKKHFSDNTITLLGRLVLLVACLQPSYLLFNLPVLSPEKKTKNPTLQKKRLIQFWNVQEIVLFLMKS